MQKTKQMTSSLSVFSQWENYRGSSNGSTRIWMGFRYRTIFSLLCLEGCFPQHRDRFMFRLKIFFASKHSWVVALGEYPQGKCSCTWTESGGGQWCIVEKNALEELFCWTFPLPAAVLLLSSLFHQICLYLLFHIVHGFLSKLPWLCQGGSFPEVVMSVHFSNTGKSRLQKTLQSIHDIKHCLNP